MTDEATPVVEPVETTQAVVEPVETTEPTGLTEPSPGRLSSDAASVASVETPAVVEAGPSTTALETTQQTTSAPAPRKLGVGEVETALHDVIDPELGVNVVDLGLVYDIKVDENNYVTIDMTLTTPACPLNDILEEDVAEVLKQLPITGHRVQWVWQPLWSPDLITEEGRQQLQMIGFRI